jgi:hypothetical protein
MESTVTGVKYIHGPGNKDYLFWIRIPKKETEFV